MTSLSRRFRWEEAPYLTVGHLLRQFQELDPDMPVRLAAHFDFPFAHHVGAGIIVRDGTAYIADDGQEDYAGPCGVSPLRSGGGVKTSWRLRDGVPAAVVSAHPDGVVEGR